VHHGPAEAKRQQRALLLAEAFAKNPARFPNGLPQPKTLPSAVWINPPAKRVEVAEGDNTMTRESRLLAIIDPGASVEVATRPRAITSVHRIGEIIQSSSPWASAIP
jgi:hypothetical protein